MNTYCLTNEKHYWLLPAFTHLYRMFWPWQEVVIAGYGAPEKALGIRWQFQFHSISQENYPVERWTNGLIAFLQQIDDEYLVLMLEDYWLSAPVSPQLADLFAVIESGYFGTHFLRLDLSADRASHPYTLHQAVTGYEIISTAAHTPYQMSFQAAVWHRANLLKVLQPGETPWEAEGRGRQRLAGIRPSSPPLLPGREKGEYLVLGTLNRPVQYTPVYRSRRNTLDLQGLPQEQVDYLRRQAWV